MDALPWLTPPNWSTPVTERIEWKTDVIPAFNGSEQRVALRQTPRRWFEFSILLEGDTARREFEAMLWAWGAKPWALPIWTDATPASVAISAGTTTIYLDTTHADFYSDGFAMLLSGTRYEVLSVLAVSPDHLTLSQPVATHWPVDTVIFPVRTAYLEQQQQVTRFSGSSLYGTVRMMLDDINDHPAEIPDVVYRGYPVITQPSIWTTDLTVDYQRQQQVVDFGVGGVYRDDETGQPTLIHNHHWTLDSRAKIAAFRSFLYARRGRLSAVWLPTFMPDLHVIAPVVATSLQINIQHCKYTTLYALKRNRRDIRIELANGVVLYRRIVASAVIDATTEQLSLDSPIGFDLDSDDIEQISFMSVSRLDTDAIELSWQWGDLVNCALNWRSTNDDL